MCYINSILIYVRFFMIYAIGNTKGGVGKTTIALNIALAKALQGRDVWLVDGDIQGTAQEAISIRSENNRNPVISCSSFPDGKNLRAQVQQQSKKFDDVVIDVGGRDSTTLRAALSLCDVLVIPFQPRSFDVWAVDNMLEVVNEALSLRNQFPVYAVLNMADVQGKDNEEAAQAISEISGVQYLNTPICRRKSYANAAGQGLSIFEYIPKDQKAVDEFSNFLNKF